MPTSILYFFSFLFLRTHFGLANEIIDVRYPALTRLAIEILRGGRSGEGERDGVKERGEEAGGCLQGL